MRRPSQVEARCFEIMKLCNAAVEEQHRRERGLPYGLDDYTEGRIVGAANLGRKIAAILRGDAHRLHESPSRFVRSG